VEIEGIDGLAGSQVLRPSLQALLRGQHRTGGRHGPAREHQGADLRLD